ncbi:MAG: hypothetical protein ACE5GQ_11465 [Nitrospinales bacterium]
MQFQLSLGHFQEVCNESFLGFWVLCALLMAGCVTYEHKTKSAEEFSADSKACDEQAENMAYGSFNRNVIAKNCLRQKGWYRKE